MVKIGKMTRYLIMKMQSDDPVYKIVTSHLFIWTILTKLSLQRCNRGWQQKRDISWPWNAGQGNNSEKKNDISATIRPESDWDLIRVRSICDMKGAHLEGAGSMLRGPSKSRRGPCAMAQWHNGQSDSVSDRFEPNLFQKWSNFPLPSLPRLCVQALVTSL